MPQSPYAIEMTGVSKRFGAVQANKNIDMRVRKGAIHGVIGENGAGKSTLMSILYGFYRADEGEIRIDGEAVDIRDSHAAIALGVGMVHQHFMLVEPFTVLENVILGVEGGSRLKSGMNAARRELERLEREFGLEVDPDAVVRDLSVGLRQRVEILKALYRGAEILILDEPTGALTPSEADHLFRILDQLRSQGKTILLITHKLREIMAITDSVSVMRRGEMVASLETAETSPQQLAELMVGRSVLMRVDKEPAQPGETRLSVGGLTVRDAAGVARVKNASFEVRAGEIVGVAGVSGNGQSELLEALAGMRPAAAGEIRVGEGAALVNPSEARRQGVAHVPEDRSRIGLVGPFLAWENTGLGWQDSYAQGLQIDRRRLRADADRQQQAFDVRPRDIGLKTANFSGGNQQKIILAREFDHDPEVLLIGQPTRGIDIGAIEFIHRRIIEMRDAGKAILLVSVELDEIRALSDRILVMCAGEIVGERGPEASEQDLGLLMAGVRGDAA